MGVRLDERTLQMDESQGRINIVEVIINRAPPHPPPSIYSNL